MADAAPRTGTALRPLSPRARFLLRCDPDALAAVGSAFGVTPRAEPLSSAVQGQRAALWLGPDEWLLKLADRLNQMPLGIVGIAVPVLSTSQTKDVANIGDLKLQTTQSTSYTVPPLVSAGALAVGVVLLGAGLMRRRV